MILPLTSFLLQLALLISKKGGQAFVVNHPLRTSTRNQAGSSSRRFVQQWQPPSNNNDDNNFNKNDNNFATMGGDRSDPYVDFDTQVYFDGTKPDNAFNLATQNFKRQGLTIIDQFLETIRIRPKDPYSPPECLPLYLSNQAVAEMERRREASGGRVDAHPVSRSLYNVGCLFLDRLFDERPIQRFWFLETIARVPYFAYVSMLHLYESLGWFRAVELRKVHAAEDWNELHHLLIMESLGGNARWSDRFLGYHVAIVYYWFLILVYFGSPRIAYQFMELLEAHAVDTYSAFITENRNTLASLPPPTVARSYYKTGDLYLFDDFQVSLKPGTRRPPCETLLDVFTQIAIDEGEHVKTMQACQDYSEYGTAVVSPHLQFDGEMQNRRMSLSPAQLDAIADDKRNFWKKWSAQLNDDMY